MAERQVSLFGPPAHFYECPRWRDGRWWASDMRGGSVYSFSQAGDAVIEAELQRPGGIGWTNEGRLLLVSMEAKLLFERSVDGKSNARIFDLAAFFGDTEGFLNDLTVSAAGHVYIGLDADPRRHGLDGLLGKIVHIAPDGVVRIAAEGLAFPNGIVCSPDGSMLIVAETMLPRLIGFPILADGALGAASVWAEISPAAAASACGLPAPGRAVALDGCAIDAEGFVWAADVGSGCLRIAPGGAIVDAVVLPEGLRSFACALGGPDGSSLLICGADDNFADRTSRRQSQLFITKVDVPAA